MPWAHALSGDVKKTVRPKKGREYSRGAFGPVAMPSRGGSGRRRRGKESTTERGAGEQSWVQLAAALMEPATQGGKDNFVTRVLKALGWVRHEVEPAGDCWCIATRADEMLRPNPQVNVKKLQSDHCWRPL